jgi:glycosyltransferase involved in cell wall biosynthesis
VRATAHFVEAVLLADELRRKSIRHVHAHFANSGATVALLASKFLGISWSFVVHGPSETDYPAGYLLADKVRSADMVVCVSWFGHSQAMRLVSPDHWRKFRLVHCGIELDRLPSETVERRDPQSIICVGRLCSDKAQAGLLEAFRQVQHKHPGATLKFVGDGPDRAELERLSQEMELGGNVQFLGRLPEAETLRQISAAGMMVLPSFWEGLPVALMEAMAMGVPVVTSRIAGVPEMITHNENGLLFAPAKWSELAECINRLLADEELGKRLSAAGRKTIQSKFDIQESARRLKGYFEDLLEHKALDGSVWADTADPP